MTGGGVEVEVVELLQVANPLERWAAERAFAVKGVKNDAFEEVAEGEVVVFGEGFEDFQNALLHADAGLDSFDF